MSKLPSVQTFVKVDSVLSRNNLLLSSFCTLVHHCCSFYTSAPPANSLPAAKQTLILTEGNI